jgi:hypothetical protein
VGVVLARRAGHTHEPTGLLPDPLSEGGDVPPKPAQVDWKVALDEKLRPVVR